MASTHYMLVSLVNKAPRKSFDILALYKSNYYYYYYYYYYYLRIADHVLIDRTFRWSFRDAFQTSLKHLHLKQQQTR